MGLIRLCPCDCSGSVTITNQISPDEQATLIADICPDCEGGGTATYTEVQNQTTTLSFIATNIGPTSCITNGDELLSVAGEGNITTSIGTFPATFTISFYEAAREDIEDIAIINIHWFDAGVPNLRQRQFTVLPKTLLTITDCP
ncbi:hypothetical protein [Bacillus dakarensis]|uniref:hypothetical protein n=1 Tax=Robertmurraya dakarensis TaxID=1926278 RepID=UPI000981B7E4|nr:hypothetical protein [Bacillus dakarensis]